MGVDSGNGEWKLSVIRVSVVCELQESESLSFWPVRLGAAIPELRADCVSLQRFTERTLLVIRELRAGGECLAERVRVDFISRARAEGRPWVPCREG